MITVSKLSSAIGLTPIHIANADREVTGGYAGDLLSWVMGRANDGDAWITIMSNVNVAAVAQLSDVAMVIFAEGVTPDNAALDAARLHNINLYGSGLSTFALCMLIGNELASGGI